MTAIKSCVSNPENMGAYGWRVDRTLFHLAFRALSHHITAWRYQGE